MDEEEWLSTYDIEPMLRCLVERLYPEAEPCNWGSGERKKQLFISACLHQVWDRLPSEYQAVFALLDTSDSNKVPTKTRQKLWQKAEKISWEHSGLLFYLGYDDIGMLCHTIEQISTTGRSERDPSIAIEQANLLREIFGNPFRSATMNAGWRSPDVLDLARGIYIFDDRAFDRLPILADALMDAGCDDEAILSHCRSEGPHVRGCWVVDLILDLK